ncbi:hypothetical protein [Nocardia sp. NBC_01327]|uniref:hypothetical protein n=1 Tax=Nocardia sp. NBC_01327 TaxID=2903593 RepID=UPI002E1088B0|nr:hypothetical protein OG326_41665 [Nocardia sp. NBC_01327]
MATVTAISIRSAARPPCADVPNDWDLDVGTPETWRTAVQICRDCPLLADCSRLAKAFIARGDAPRAMIWAGVGYDNVGRVVDDLDRHRIAPIDRSRPMRIIRSGTSPACTEPALTAPRRHLVLGQPLRPTGTDCG